MSGSSVADFTGHAFAGAWCAPGSRPTLRAKLLVTGVADGGVVFGAGVGVAVSVGAAVVVAAGGGAACGFGDRVGWVDVVEVVAGLCPCACPAGASGGVHDCGGGDLYALHSVGEVFPCHLGVLRGSWGHTDGNQGFGGGGEACS